MTRQKEINKAANDRIKAERMDKEWVLCYYDAFTTGAKWADLTMIDKACEWLKKHYAPAGFVDGIFRKAMLGEE